MAAVVNLQRTPETSLGRLGDVLFASASDMADKRRQDEREARLRAQRLQDVQSERDYVRTEGDRQYGRSRTDRLADTKDARTYEESIYGRNLDDKRDDVADERVWKLMENSLERHLRDNPAGAKQAQERLNQLASERTANREKQNDLERSLSRPEPRPDPIAVRNKATEMARAAIPKVGLIKGLVSGQPTEPGRAEIEALIPGVESEMRAQINADWQRARMDAQLQQQVLAAEARDISAESNVITNVFRRVGISGAPTQGAGAGAPPTTAAPDARTGLRNLSDPAPSGAPQVPNLAAAQSTILSALKQQIQPKPQGPATSAPSSLVEPAQPAPPVDRGIRFTPPAPQVFAPTQTPPGMGGSRANEAIGDTMRAVGYGVSNMVRPSSWSGDFNSASFGIDPMVEAEQLRGRLDALGDKTSPTAVALRNRLLQLENSLAQKMTRSARLIEPMNSATESRPAAAARFEIPGY